MTQNIDSHEVKSGWKENWRERILVILLLILGGLYVYTHPPKTKHRFEGNSKTYSIDGLYTNVEWTSTYKAKPFLSQSDKDVIEKSVQGLVCLGLNYTTLKYPAHNLTIMNIDSIQNLFNNIPEIKKLDSLDIQVELNKFSTFTQDSTFTEFFKIFDSPKDTVTIKSK